MTDIIKHTIQSPVGKLTLTIKNEMLTELSFAHQEATTPTDKHPCIDKITQELNAYFSNPTHTFTIPINLLGTPFQQSVWKALQSIPTGKTMTYGELAKKLKTAPRAIGQACRTNPIPIIIPCHRVVGASSQGGYVGETSGKSVNIKQYLLTHEQRKNHSL